MNAWGLLIALVGGVLIIMGIRGQPDNIIAAAKGQQYGSSTLK
jgi:hypothetical protein